MTRAVRVRRACRRRRRDTRGAVALEFALILPILAMLLLGVTTMGLAYSDHLAVTNAVREGARIGAALDSGAAGWGNAVQTRVIETYFNAGSLPSSQICALLVDSSGTTVAQPSPQGTSCGTQPLAPTGMASGTCAVLVWARRPESVTLGVLPDLHFDVAAQSSSYYGRATTACPGS